MRPLQGLAFLLLMQSGGEALSHFLKLPVPGPVVGMVLSLLALRWSPVQAAVAPAGGFLLSRLSLLFVAVGVDPFLPALWLVSTSGVTGSWGLLWLAVAFFGVYLLARLGTLGWRVRTDTWMHH